MAKWLDDDEAAVWQPFVVSTLHLFAVLDDDLKRDFGITHLDYGILAQLSFTADGQVRMAELANRFGVERTMITYRVKRLERMGLVERRPDPVDGRGVLAHLVPAGADLLTRAAPAHVEAVRRHFIDHLRPEELPVLAAAFTRLQRLQEEHTP